MNNKKMIVKEIVNLNFKLTLDKQSIYQKDMSKKRIKLNLVVINFSRNLVTI